MKKSITIIMLLITSMSYGQLQKSEEVKEIKLNLDKCHREYSTGTAFIFTGIALAGVAIVTKETVDDPSTTGIISGLGALTATIGYCIQLDSHKWIKRAAK